MHISRPAALLLLAATAVGQHPSISFQRDISPLLAARCAGCHRPGKTEGGLDLSNFAAFARGGKSGRAFVAGDAEHSLVLRKVGGPKPAMPPRGTPLTSQQVANLRAWIAAGARDDTVTRRPATHAPAVYRSAPAIPALAFSPDGRLLAVAGYHEVVLLEVPDGDAAPQPIARLVGGAPRIESLAFSRDGARLAAAGGAPARFGEVQVWDVRTRQPYRRHRVGSDVLYGISFAPDGRSVAFGGADKTVRMLRVDDGAELLLFRNHAEWVLGTCFTRDGKRLVSAGRDRAMKIIDLAEQRFVDDINNPYEPILALARHPQSDIVAYGGALGACYVYRISDNQKRTAARLDTNLVHVLTRHGGAVHAVAFDATGGRIATGGEDDQVHIHDSKSGKLLLTLRGYRAPVFALAFHPREPLLATAGFEGLIRVYDARDGKLRHTVVPVPVQGGSRPVAAELITSLQAIPDRLSLDHARDQRRILVQGRTRDGKLVDLTGRARFTADPTHLTVGADGYLTPHATGATTVRVQAAGLSLTVPVQVNGVATHPVHFCRDVMPVLGRAGCNAGTCHGARDGKNGFALSLRGFDPAGDYRALVHDLSGRRFDRVSPEQSLMLLKPTTGVPHEGGKVLELDSRAYRLIADWIRQGTRFRDDDASRVVGLEVLPRTLDLSMPQDHQQVLVIARYADGSTADVTRDAHMSVSDTEVAAMNGTTITALRRGEAAVLVRYEGRYATAPITIMGDRSGFAWQGRPQHNFIDRLVDAKLQTVKTLPAPLCSDAEFVRRVHLDLTGKPPTPEQARAFVAAAGPTRVKREQRIDQLIGSPEFVAHWSNKWADLLQCNSTTLGAEGVWVFRDWLAESIARNKPYDRFVRELLTATGATLSKPAANYMRALSDRGREPDTGKMAEDVTQTFLGVRFGCCKCHNHPFERWTQGQYYELAAHFARVRLKASGSPGEMVVFDQLLAGEVTHPRHHGPVAPQVPFGARHSSTPEQRRAALADWLTSKDNRLFARSYVNRVWSYLFGIGIIEPVDDIRAGNPPSNAALLDALEKHFVDSGFDVFDLIRTICRSHTWQRSFRSNRWNADDRVNFARSYPRRLSAEQLLDAVAIATGVTPRIGNLPAGSRAVDAPDGEVRGNDFLALFGRPKRESACECARSSNLSLAHALNLVGGRTLHGAITDPNGRVARLVGSGAADAEIVTDLFWAALCRAPTTAEVKTFASLGTGPQRVRGAQDLLWALTNSPAFLFNR
ncbi:MAG: DUF1549 domain-containing protein [Planctomycetes bacterium]|nr:DUF1549 domain-containing protein [Planctomycetota bacterium]MCB9869782.1 DUF1549 domain-containing protein [Planctomycetota bacterium]